MASKNKKADKYDKIYNEKSGPKSGCVTGVTA